MKPRYDFLLVIDNVENYVGPVRHLKIKYEKKINIYILRLFFLRVRAKTLLEGFYFNSFVPGICGKQQKSAIFETVFWIATVITSCVIIPS